jgi:hypothetical protein
MPLTPRQEVWEHNSLYIVLKRGIELQEEDGAMIDTLPNPKVDLMRHLSILDLYYIMSKIPFRV